VEQGLLGVCVEGLLESCREALGVVEEAREAVGKHRGKGGGLARLLRGAAGALQGGLEPCIRGCLGGGPGAGEALRCGLGEAADRLARSLHGLAVRLERLPRLGGGVEEELAAAVLDAVYAALDSLCGLLEEAVARLSG